MKCRQQAMLRAVATDGHRLAQAQIARPDGAKGMPGIIVPRKTVLELVKLIEGERAMSKWRCRPPRSASPSAIWCSPRS